MKENPWARLLAYVTGLINQELLLKNEYLGAKNRILQARYRAGTETEPKHDVEGIHSIASGRV